MLIQYAFIAYGILFSSSTASEARPALLPMHRGDSETNIEFTRTHLEVMVEHGKHNPYDRNEAWGLIKLGWRALEFVKLPLRLLDDRYMVPAPLVSTVIWETLKEVDRSTCRYKTFGATDLVNSRRD